MAQRAIVFGLRSHGGMRQVAPKANPGSDILYYPSTAQNTPPGSHCVTVTHNSADRLILHVPAKRVSILTFAQPILSFNTLLNRAHNRTQPAIDTPMEAVGRIATPIRLKILRPIVPAGRSISKLLSVLFAVRRRPHTSTRRMSFTRKPSGAAHKPLCRFHLHNAARRSAECDGIR